MTDKAPGGVAAAAASVGSGVVVFLLTGDIGGTNSRMSLYETTTQKRKGHLDNNNNNEDDSHTQKPVRVKWYRNSEYIPQDCHGKPDCFQRNVVAPFLRLCHEAGDFGPGFEVGSSTTKVEVYATLATAGIVANNRVHMTNLGNMLVDGNAIQDSQEPYLQMIKVCTIINDFVAQGYGCLTLRKEDVRHLGGPGNIDDLPIGPKVCIGAGTGLGECYLTPNHDNNSTDGRTSSSYNCYPSEGGHVEFAPRNDLEVKMFKYMSGKFSSKDRISVERVVSGRGLANVYEFLAQEYPTRIRKEVHDEFLHAGDEQGKVVSQNATEGSLCQQALKIMMSSYGCEVGSAAIKWIPTGGLFVTGGLTPKNILYIDGDHTDFMVSYRNKGRVSAILSNVPLFAVMSEDLGVRGVHKAALIQYDKYLQKSASGGGPTSKGAFNGYLRENLLLVTAAAAAASFGLGMLLSKKRQ